MVVKATEINPNFFTPRDYQIELLEKALNYNTIIPLGTGSGKTFIAVLLIKEYTQLLLPKFSNGGKRAVFIVDKVALVKQQADHIECHTELKVAQFHGYMNTDVCNTREAFEKVIEDSQVLVLTAQIFLMLLDHAIFSFDRVPVIVMDECHHVLGGKHPYRLIVQRYSELSEETRPRMLGLTASLINNKTAPSELEALLRQLETIMKCRIEASSDIISVAKYGARPKELVIACRDNDFAEDWIRVCLKSLQNLRESAANCLDFHPDLDVDPRKSVVEAATKILSVLQQMGPWCAWKVAMVWEKQLRKIHTSKSKASGLGEKQIAFLQNGESKIHEIIKEFEQKVKTVRSYEELKKYIPHKVERLLELLRYYHPNIQKTLQGGGVKSLSAMVFVDQRYVAYAMNLLMKSLYKWNQIDFGHLRSDFVIGFNGTSLGEESAGFHKRQETVLEKFRQSQLNLLFTTSVLEEGVDVKHCNLVIKFDSPGDFRSYIQSRGRARKQGAHYFMLTEAKNKLEFALNLRNFCEIERMLITRTVTIHDPEHQVPARNVDDVVQPYVVTSTGAKVTMSTAIALINKYCAKLPSDVFTRLVPQSCIEPVTVNGVTKFLATLSLPINSPFKEEIRLKTPMDTKKLAQMAVALEACRQLHEKNELNDYLLPAGKDAIAATFLLDEDPDEYVPHMPHKAGSIRRKQLYDKKMDLLVEASGAANPKRRKIANPLDNDYFFGFLSKRILPEVPSFPIFPRQGKVLVSIKLCKNQITLDEETFERAMKFHEYLFDDVLGLAKQGFVEFVPRHAPIATVIVPLKRREHAVYDLDRVYLSNILEYRRIPYTPSEEERRTFQFREEDFTDAIVVPWYRNQDVFYDVAVINHSLTPASGFPDGNYTNFREYYMKRYNLEIFNETQPLLDVDYTSTRMNLVMPRIPTRSQGKEKKSDRTQHQVMVPELVNVHPIPASLWNSIVTLPTIIYRANALLLADELRELICAEALGPNDNSVHICWEPLDYVTSYSEDAQLPINKLSHLEKDLEAERAKARAENPEPEIVDMEDDSSNDGFNIGVWDPKLGDGGELAGRILTVPFPMASSARTDEEIADEAADMIVTSGNLNNGNMSDDEDDQGEMKMLMDYAHIYKNDSSSFLPVRDNIEELGWDADIGQLNISEDAFPVSITGTSASIDGKSLMKDIASVLDPSFAGNGVASANGSAPNGSGDAVFAKSKPVATRLDLSAFDDRDAPLIRTGENESLNLIEYFMDSNDSQEVERMKKASLEIESSRPHLENFPVVEVEEEGTPQKAIEIDNSLFTNPNVLQPEINAYTDGDVGERSEVARVIPKTTFMKPDVKVNFTDEGMPECSAGVSPCVLLQALTLSHASDGINLERLETVGDSFLKFAVTDYLFHEHKEQHEGKLSFARSKEVSNYNLYRIGKKKNLPSILVASKFEPTDSWLPPCYMPTGDFKGPNAEDAEATDKFMDAVFEGKPIPQSKKPLTGWDEDNNEAEKVVDGIETINLLKNPTGNTQYDVNEEISPLPYNVMTQQYISDKAIADTVEALIGAHLLQLGPKVALRFMRWLGLRVISEQTVADEPLLRFLDTPEDPNRSNQELVSYIERFQLSSVEKTIGYRFNNKAYLLQAFTHASYYKNRITSCYQRLEFLGDAVLDYMITRFLFQHRKKYSPGVLTDLRSALVNNTIFASLAVKYNFHKHFVAMCPGLHHMIEKFVRLCESQAKNTNFNSELYMVTEEEFDDGDEEDIEVPKALGDIFESLAGAIYLDSGRRLDVVWEVFYNLMHDTIMECCEHPPKSPIRELLEREPDKARFSKLERIRENGKIRVTVDIQGKCRFTGIGRSYRIAKCTAAKRALRYLRDLDKEREAAKKASAHH
ncbi:hypothetical protein L596_024412 [Steinernema carpocapsae]|uniref:Uncharacterized protein n=1 Tax=Steinernema carpocapsae TaxID=34508 RepID=A0A4U5MHD9_STECR|nr:hypothetical protein L596_024412 [Steinernema carpocapsae]